MLYILTFIKSFFDIGNSAGSLFYEAITLFKTFQRISAPQNFVTKLSPECIEMFKWASNAINYVTGAFKTIPLTDYELFTVYSFVFPISIFVFISCTVYRAFFFIVLLLMASSFIFGKGVIQYMNDHYYNIFMIFGGIGTFILLIVFITSFIRCKSSKSGYGKRNLSFLQSSIGFFIFLYILMSPIMLLRWKLAKILSIIVGIMIFLIFIILITVYCISEDFADSIPVKLYGFAITCLTLIIVPSTECFSNLIQGYYNNQWVLILAYSLNSVIIPIAVVVAMIILNHPNISDKYKSCGSILSHGTFELVDHMKQIGYAFAAIYDVLWACLVIEIVWIILVFVFRPYKNVSEYSLSAGNSLITIITNSAIIYSNNHKKQFNLGVSIFFVVFACIPAIVSLYLYFIFDFVKDIDDDDDFSLSDEFSFSNEYSYGNIMAYVTIFMLPICCFCYGVNYNLVARTVEMPFD